jgi:hypothetical protein
VLRAARLTSYTLCTNGYKQRRHLCYVLLGLRVTPYMYLPPLLTLQSTVIVSRKYYLLVKRS